VLRGIAAASNSELASSAPSGGRRARRSKSHTHKTHSSTHTAARSHDSSGRTAGRGGSPLNHRHSKSESATSTCPTPADGRTTRWVNCTAIIGIFRSRPSRTHSSHERDQSTTRNTRNAAVHALTGRMLTLHTGPARGHRHRSAAIHSPPSTLRSACPTPTSSASPPTGTCRGVHCQARSCPVCS